MKFDLQAMDRAGFDGWVATAKSAGAALDDAGYAKLAEPSSVVAPVTYRAVDPGLFESIVGMKTPPPEGQQGSPNAPVSPRGGN